MSLELSQLTCTEPRMRGEAWGLRASEHDSVASPIDFEAYYSDIREAVPSKGRQPGDGESVTTPALWSHVPSPPAPFLASGFPPPPPTTTIAPLVMV